MFNNKGELSHDYFDGKSVKSVGPVADEIECFVECVKKNDCIRYLMFTSKECCLMTSLDLQASIYKPENTKTSSLISNEPLQFAFSFFVIQVFD